MKTLISCLFVVTLLLLTYQNGKAQTNRKIILEDITAAWCGLCPEGLATSNQITNNFANVIPIAIHIADPMEIPETATIGDIYTGSGVNAFLLDRYLFPDLQFVPFTFEYQPLALKVAERLAMPASVAIDIQNVSYDTLSRTLQATVKAQFINSVENYNDLRFNFFLVEDSVISTASGYAQVNFFHTTPGYFYSGAGNPMYNFPHRHVLRAALGGTWGTENSLTAPNSIAIADTFTHTYTYAIPETWKLNKLSLVGMVQNYNALNYHNNEILNAQNITLIDALTPPNLPIDTTFVDTTTVITDTTTVITDTTVVDTTATYIIHTKQPQFLQVFPNPANNLVQISYCLPQNGNIDLAIYDLSGKKLQTLQQEPKNAGNYVCLWQANSLPTGVYFVGLTQNGQQMYTKLIISK